MKCLMVSRHSMTATVLRPGGVTPEPSPTSPSGHWEKQQDPESWAFIDVWVPDDTNPATPEVEVGTFPCTARGIISEGVSAAGSTEEWNRRGDYENIEYVKLTFPKNVVITKRDRITNIRDANGNLIWVEDEYDVQKATVFNVNGVIPTLDAFNNHIENIAYLKRAEVQSG